MSKQIAIYLRCSTKKQEAESQKREVEKYLKSEGIKSNCCKLYIDYQSGKSMKRPQLNKLQEEMLRGKVHSIYLYSLDRLSRAGTESVMSFLSIANSKGIKVEFISDKYLNHSDPLIKNILITVISELARKEREKIVKRVVAGIENARINGKKLGRPPINCHQEVFELRESGKSLQVIANELGISKSSVHKTLKKSIGHKKVHKSISYRKDHKDKE